MNVTALMHKPTLNQPIYTVDASEAGEGSLEIQVRSAPPEYRPLPTHVVAAGHGLFHVAFTPRSTVDHVVHVTFNDESVPGMSNVVCSSRYTRIRESIQLGTL